MDNAAAQWALTKGYSGTSKEANVLTTLFWSVATAKQADPWFERVPSKANCSDAVSRGDFAFAESEKWVKCEIKCEQIWRLLERAVGMNLKDLPVLAEELSTIAKAERSGEEDDTDEEAVKQTERELKWRRVH